MSGFASFASKRKKVDNISLRTISDLKRRIKLVRSGWFKTALRNDTSYAPSQHDKIKMNINLYLGQMMQFLAGDMTDQNALVLDSADLGSSVVLNAFGFQPENIHVPNWFNKSTEYNIMKDRVRELSCFPVSVDDYVQAFTGSKTQKQFQTQLMGKYAKTKYTKKVNKKNKPYRPKIIEPLPSRPDGFQFVYLDYCGRFHWKKRRRKKTRYNSDTVKDMFDAKCFSKTEPFVFALTGSFMMISKEKYNSELEKYRKMIKEAAEKNGYKIRIDQYFVYNRSTQSGEADDVIGYQDEEDIPEDVPSKIARGSKMFFMSFIGSYDDEAVSNWDSLFSQCKNGACKLEIKHKDCLYQAGQTDLGTVFLSKPFCNYKITDFYIVSEVKNRESKEIQALVNKFKELPWKRDLEDDQDRAEALVAANKRKGNHFANGVIKLFLTTNGGGENELLDITKMIEHVKKGRSGDSLPQNDSGRFIFRLDDILDIKYPAKVVHSVSIEVIYDNLVGVHFVNDKVLKDPNFNNIKPKMKVNESCYIFHKDDLAKYVVDSKTDQSCFTEGQEVEVNYNDTPYRGVIRFMYDDGDYEVFFKESNTLAKVSRKSMLCVDGGVKRKKVKVKRRNKEVEFTQGERIKWNGIFGVVEEIRRNKNGEKEYVVFLEAMSDPGWLDDPENIKGFKQSRFISWSDYVYEHHPAYRIMKGSELEKVDEAEEYMGSSSKYSLKF